MTDPFLKLIAQGKSAQSGHAERKHSKFSASGFDRIMGCPGSVQLSEGMKSKENASSREGTHAHEVLEAFLKTTLVGAYKATTSEIQPILQSAPRYMLDHVRPIAQFISDLASQEDAELLVETRVYLDFIHPEAFGTFDSAILDYFGTLHVFDFKYGKYAVSPKENYQMIFYALGLAHLHHWNFKRVRVWIAQPRAKNYRGPVFWEISMAELKSYIPVFKEAIRRAIEEPNVFVEDPKWCYFCVAKTKCPLKQENRIEEAQSVFKLKNVNTEK